jgi:fibronectin-binding autotransporter adhesin
VSSPLRSLASRPGDYDALSGGIQSSAVTVLAQSAFIVQQTILDHLRFGEGGFGGTGIAGAAPGARLPATFTADIPGRPPVISTVPVQVVSSTYALWGHAFGGYGTTATTAGSYRTTRDLGGFVVGIETGLSGGWKAGVAAGYSVTELTVRRLSSRAEIESGYVAAYANGPVGPLQLRLGASYMAFTLNTQRLVAFPGLTDALRGQTTGETGNGFAELGYRVATATSYVEPFVGAAVIRITRDGFTEQGGIAALTVANRAWNIETATAGVQAQAQVAGFGPGELPLILRGLVAYRRAFGDVTPTSLQSFTAAGQGFLTAGVPIDRDAAVASIGANLQLSASTTIGVAYNAQVGLRAQDHTGKGTFSYRF